MILIRKLTGYHCIIMQYMKNRGILFSNNSATESIYRGWIQHIRESKNLCFIDLYTGSSNLIQVVVVNSELRQQTKKLTVGSSIEVKGELYTNPSKRTLSDLHAKDIKIIGLCDTNSNPIKSSTSYSFDILRKYLHLRPRTEIFRAIFKVRSIATHAIHTYFSSNDYIFVNPPILTNLDCEGAGDIFNVNVNNTRDNKNSDLLSDNTFFNSNIFLSISGQLHIEALTYAFPNVYTHGPIFRADKSHTKRHLAEFYMLEVERAWITTVQEITTVVEQLCKYIIEHTLKKCEKEIITIYNKTSLGGPEYLQDIIHQDFVKLSYSQAIDIINKSDRTQLKTEWGKDISNIAERFILSHFGGNVPVFITDYPAKLKPFYMLKNKDDPTTAACFDLLWPNVGELVGGSLREHDKTELERNIVERNINRAELEWYIDLRKFGTVPMGGFGLGFERLVQGILCIDIRDTIAFPRYYKHAPY